MNLAAKNASAAAKALADKKVDWKTVKLGEVADYRREKISVSEVSIEDYISTENMLPEKGGVCKASSIPEEGCATFFKKGDILISNIRPYFKKIWLARWDSGCSNDVLVVRGGERVNSRYLSYLLSDDAFFSYVMAGAKGTKMPRGDRQQILEYEFPLPPLPTQRKIAAVLGAIDDKIENNRKICANLEAQAQALFKSWFVDFEPFGGKMPEGWKEIALSDAIAFQEGPGIRNWQYVPQDGVRFINIRCIHDGDINLTTANMISNEEASGKYAHFMLRENDIVMSCSGTLGRCAIVRKSHLPLCLNTSVIRFYPKHNDTDFSWIYGYLKSDAFLLEQAARANGSCQVNFGPTHLKEMKVIFPDEDIRKKYYKVVSVLLQKIMSVKEQSRALAELRDALLPRLMSGEIDVSEVAV